METTLNKPNTQKICSLEEALAYQNDTVVYKFLEFFDVPFEEAQDLFHETKKWLWLCALTHVTEGAPKANISKSLIMLDKMWHNFILFTREYHDYCQSHFGHFIHHSPTPKHVKEKFRKRFLEDREGYFENQEKENRVLYGFIYDHLGEETLQKWYSEYLDKYTPEYINSIFIRPQ